jgi:hypothetical protein
MTSVVISQKEGAFKIIDISEIIIQQKSLSEEIDKLAFRLVDEMTL